MKLRRWIFRNGRTITSFASEIGITRNYLSILLMGKRKPSKKLMLKIRITTDEKVKFSGDIIDEKIPLEQNGEPSKGQNEN